MPVRMPGVRLTRRTVKVLLATVLVVLLLAVSNEPLVQVETRH